MASNRASSVLVIGILVIHTGLLAWIGVRTSPVSDEASHLAAGVALWMTGRTDLYAVNPPFVRVIASAPVALSSPKLNLIEADAVTRPEWSVGIGFVRLGGCAGVKSGFRSSDD